MTEGPVNVFVVQSSNHPVSVQRYELIVKICKFSSESICKPGEISKSIEYFVDPEICKCNVLPQIYANGRDDDGKGYVSVNVECSSFGRYRYCSSYEFSCTVSVIDVSGATKFPKFFTFLYSLKSLSHTYPKDKLPVLMADKCISHETLFSEPLELLPEDCLTLHIDITNVIELPDEDIYEIQDNVMFSFEEEETSEGKKFDLILDSEVAKRLYVESSVFQAMYDYLPFDDSSTVPIPSKDVPGLKNVCRIILGAKTIAVSTIDEVCQIYVVADKYDIQSVIETSREFIRSFLCNKNDPEVIRHVDENIPLLLEFAESQDDVFLKEIVERLVRSRNESCFEDSGGASESKGTEWTCKSRVSEQSVSFELSKEIDTGEYQFYQ